MDSFGRHESSITPSGVRIESVPPRSTKKHQPLDIGLIASANIRYRTRLLSAVLDVSELQHNTNQSFKETSCNGKWGLEDGTLSHVWAYNITVRFNLEDGDEIGYHQMMDSKRMS